MKSAPALLTEEEKEELRRSEEISFLNEFFHISSQDLDEILESLHHRGFLSERGEEFWRSFWELFVKENN